MGYEIEPHDFTRPLARAWSRLVRDVLVLSCGALGALAYEEHARRVAVEARPVAPVVVPVKPEAKDAAPVSMGAFTVPAVGTVLVGGGPAWHASDPGMDRLNDVVIGHGSSVFSGSGGSITIVGYEEKK